MNGQKLAHGLSNSFFCAQHGGFAAVFKWLQESAPGPGELYAIRGGVLGSVSPRAGVPPSLQEYYQKGYRITVTAYKPCTANGCASGGGVVLGGFVQRTSVRQTDTIAYGMYFRRRGAMGVLGIFVAWN